MTGSVNQKSKEYQLLLQLLCFSVFFTCVRLYDSDGIVVFMVVWYFSMASTDSLRIPRRMTNGMIVVMRTELSIN